MTYINFFSVVTSPSEPTVIVFNSIKLENF